MAVIEWKKEYSVNISLIDKQHQRWVEIIKSLYEAMKHGKGREKIAEVFNQVVSYTQQHFSTEEQLLINHGYPDYDSHKLIHDKFVKQTEELLEKHKKGTKFLTIPVSHMLNEWLVNHITVTDKQYASFLNSKGIE